MTSWLKADEELKSIPVIAVTAFAMRGDEQKIREGGCEDYLSKPISVLSFIETIKKHLERPVPDADASETETDDEPEAEEA